MLSEPAPPAFLFPMSDLKNLPDLYREIDAVKIETPPVVLISGIDPSTFDLVLERIRTLLKKSTGTVETTIYSGEPGDGEKFLTDVFNIPLFSPYRLLVVRRGQDVFKEFLGGSKQQDYYRSEFSRVPDSTWILIQYDGKPPAGFLKVFADRLLHFQTRELYPRDVIRTIEGLERKYHLQLDEEALFELRERVEPRTGAIEQSLARLQELLPEEKQGRVNRDDIRELLFPSPGLNAFRLIDGLFEQNHNIVRRELKRWNPSVDNYFLILKLILNRIDEIRKASIALSHGTTDRELTTLLGHSGKPPFVQKKIQERLHEEIRRFDSDKQGKIYDLLIQTQIDFRSTGNSGIKSQHTLFQERILRTFFGDTEDGVGLLM